MKNKLVILIVGIIVGAILAAGGEAIFLKPTPAASAASPELRNAEKELARDQVRSDDLSQREAVIKAKLAELGPNAPDLSGQQQSVISKAITAQLKQRQDARMAALKAHITNLTDDEMSAISDLLDKDAQKQQDAAEKMMSGQLSQADIRKLVAAQRGGGDLDQEMQTILTPTQYIQYQNGQNDDKKNTAQMQANAEMMQVQSSLQLTDAQKDQVFTAIYSGYAQQAGVDGAKPSYDDLDIDGQINAKKAALQSVLTPDQFKTYSQFLDGQAQMIKGILQSAPAQ